MAVASFMANRASCRGYRLIAAGLLLSKAKLTETSCLTPYGPATSAGRNRRSITRDSPAWFPPCRPTPAVAHPRLLDPSVHNGALPSCS